MEDLEVPPVPEPKPKKARKRVTGLRVIWGKKTYPADDYFVEGAYVIVVKGDQRTYLPIDRPIIVKGLAQTPVALSPRGLDIRIDEPEVRTQRRNAEVRAEGGGGVWG